MLIIIFKAQLQRKLSCNGLGYNKLPVITNQMHTGGGEKGGEREGGWMRGTSCTTSKDFEKIGHKNAKNTKIDNPPLIFSQP
jgi:hypothetical protein